MKTLDHDHSISGIPAPTDRMRAIFHSGRLAFAGLVTSLGDSIQAAPFFLFAHASEGPDLGVGEPAKSAPEPEMDRHRDERGD